MPIRQSARQITLHFTERAAVDPLGAAREAEAIQYPTQRASALMAIGKTVREVAFLADARDIVTDSGLDNTQRNAKLARISFTAVGIDNAFAAETAVQIEHSEKRPRLLRQLSLAMISSVKDRIVAGKTAEFNRYPDLVVAAFHESAGDPTYYGENLGVNADMRAPKYLTLPGRAHPLDARGDAAVALEAFRDNPPYFGAMLQFIAEHASDRLK